MFSFASEQINPPTPFLDFYTFNGWTIGEKVVEDFPITNNITVVANYSYFGSINVTFDFNGGKYGISPDNISLSFIIPSF